MKKPTLNLEIKTNSKDLIRSNPQKNYLGIIKLLFSFTVILLSIPSYAQLVGYGSGGDNDHTVNGGVYYTDDVRAQVTSLSATNITISGTHLVGAFAIGDSCLLIQMVGGTIGTHEGVKISSITSSTAFGLNHSPINSYNYTGANRVQLIKVKQWDDFYLNKGTVTCHGWDGYIGGVLCMFVQDSLRINGGYFTVSGKGFYPDSVAWGTPGTGGSGSTNVGSGGTTGGGGNGDSGGGLTGCSGYSCLTGTDAGAAAPGFGGGVGGAGGSSGSSGSSNSGDLAEYSGSYLNSYITMGNAGYFPSGYGAGDGGDGGGAGGGGGATASLVAGSDGQSGTDGGDGGAPGHGATGGGIMYIKAGDIYITASGPVFFGNGGTGETGGHGENGGNGGDGGAGGQGSCSGGAAENSGGTGGSGSAGSGGGDGGGVGGDGSNGGEAGYLWIIVNQATNPVSTSNVSVYGGNAGAGGRGGYCKERKCGDAIAIDLTGCTLDIDNCSSNGCPRIDYCNCDSAYAMLATTNQSPTNNTTDNLYEFKQGSVLVATYDYINGELIGFYYGGSCDTTAYHCPVTELAICDSIFSQLMNEKLHNGTDLDLTSSSTFYKAVSPFEVQIGNNVPGSNPFFQYKGAWEYVIDYADSTYPNKCHNDACIDAAYDPDYNTYQNSSGASSGEPGPDGSTTSGDPTAHFANGAGTTLWKRDPGSLGEEEPYDAANGVVKVWPNPSGDVVNIQFQNAIPEFVYLTVYDINGKVVLSKGYSVKKDDNNIALDISSLSSGTYSIKIVSTDGIYGLKFIKN